MPPAPHSPSAGIAEALFGRTRRAVLALLFGRPEEAFYLREVVRLTGGGTGAVQRELTSLVRAGLARRDVRGRQVYFSADTRSPVYPELRALLAKTAGIADVIRAALQPFAAQKRISIAFIYGSVASNSHGPASDVDLVIIGGVSMTALAPTLRKLQEALGREVNPTIYDAAQFRAKARAGAHFVRRVLEGPKVMLIGTEDELG